MTGPNMPPWFYPQQAGNYNIEDIMRIKAWVEALEKDIKDKTVKDIDEKKKKEPKRPSAFKIFLTLSVLAIPVFIINSLLLLGGLQLIVKMARALGGM